MSIRSRWRELFAIILFATLAVDAMAAGKPNIVLITLDAVRSDRAASMPAIVRLASQGVMFTSAYAQSPLTVASTATVLSGTYPQTHRASDLAVPLPESVPYLPDVLHAHGYQTAAFVGSILLDPHSGPFQGYDRGFSLYDAGFRQPERGQNRFQTVQRRGSEVEARVARWLASQGGQPFFLWVNLDDAGGAVGAGYDRALAEEDTATGRLLDLLKSKGLLDDTLVILASSHGESLGAHGEQRNGMLLYEETMHVPLLVKLPAGHARPAEKTANRAGLVDVAPTVLEVAGIPAPSAMQGQSLLRIAQAGTQAGQSVYSRTELPQQGFACSLMESWRAGKYLYVRAPTPELYDLTADPGATHNLAQTSKAALQVMAGQLAAFDHHFEADAGKPAASRLTSSEMQKLASLGYIGLQSAGSSALQEVKGINPLEALGLANQTLAGIAAEEGGKPEQAIPLFQAALAVRQNLYLAQYGMAVALAQQQRYAQAIGYLQSAIKLQPESPWAHYTMGMSLIRTGDFKTAAVHLEIAARLLPGDAQLQALLTQAHQHVSK